MKSQDSFSVIFIVHNSVNSAVSVYKINSENKHASTNLSNQTKHNIHILYDMHIYLIKITLKLSNGRTLQQQTMNIAIKYIN